MTKKIIIVAPFCSLPGEPYFNRFLYLAYKLSKDHDVTLITSRFRHFDKTFRDVDLPKSFVKFKIVLIEEPGYRANVSLARIYSHHIFSLNLNKWLSNFLDTNIVDVIYSAYPLIETNIRIGSLKNAFNFKFIIDIQDIWPDSITSAYPLLDNFKWIFRLLTPYYNRAFLQVDGLVSVSDTYLKYPRYLNPTLPTITTYIGSDYDFLSSIQQIGFDNNKCNIVYLGSLSHSYELLPFLSAVSSDSRLSNYYKIHIIGSGPDLNYLSRYASASIKFYGMVDFSTAISYAKSANYLINPIRSSAKQSVTNKISDYIMLGVPILNSQKCDEVLDLFKLVPTVNFRSNSQSDITKMLHHLMANPIPKFIPDNEIINKFDRNISYKYLTDFINRIINV